MRFIMSLLLPCAAAPLHAQSPAPPATIDGQVDIGRRGALGQIAVGLGGQSAAQAPSGLTPSETAMVDLATWGFLAQLDGKGEIFPNGWRYARMAADGRFLAIATSSTRGSDLHVITAGPNGLAMVRKDLANGKLRYHRGVWQGSAIMWTEIDTGLPPKVLWTGGADGSLELALFDGADGRQFGGASWAFKPLVLDYNALAPFLREAEILYIGSAQSVSKAEGQLAEANAYSAKRQAEDDRIIARNAAMGGVVQAIRSVGAVVGEVTYAAAEKEGQRLRATLARQAAGQLGPTSHHNASGSELSSSSSTSPNHDAKSVSNEPAIQLSADDSLNSEAAKEVGTYSLFRWCKSSDEQKNVHYYSAVFPADIRYRDQTEVKFRSYMKSFFKQQHVDNARCGDGGTLEEAQKHKSQEEARSIKMGRQVYQTYWKE